MISLCSLCPLWLTVFIHLTTGIKKCLPARQCAMWNWQWAVFLFPITRRGQKYQSDSDPEKHSDFADQRQRHAVIEIESGGFDKRPGPRLVHSDERRDEDEAHVDRPIDRLEGACGDKIHVEPHQPQRQINFHGAGEMEGGLAQHEDEEIARTLGIKIEDVIFKFAKANDLRFDSAPPRFIARDETRQGR